MGLPDISCEAHLCIFFADRVVSTGRRSGHARSVLCQQRPGGERPVSLDRNGTGSVTVSCIAAAGTVSCIAAAGAVNCIAIRPERHLGDIRPERPLSFTNDVQGRQRAQNTEVVLLAGGLGRNRLPVILSVGRARKGGGDSGQSTENGFAC